VKRDGKRELFGEGRDVRDHFVAATSLAVARGVSLKDGNPASPG
jgi:hypothetical protein